jgi:hypothetical protein
MDDGNVRTPVSARKSRRLSHEDPDDLPSVTVCGKKTQLAQLVATDTTRGGRTKYAAPDEKAWNFLSPSAGGGKPSSDEVSSLTGDGTAGTTPAKKQRISCPEKKGGPAKSYSFDKSSIPAADGDVSVGNDVGLKLIPFDKLKRMIEVGCACKYCGSPVTLQQETYGIATNLFLNCIPCDKRRKVHAYEIISEKIPVPPPVLPTLPADADAADAVKVDGRKVPHEKSAKRFLLNMLLVLAMQQLGLGIESVQIFLGMLGMRATIGNKKTWKEIQDIVGIAEQEVKKEVIAENIETARAKALEAGAKQVGDRVAITAAADAGWQKRKVGHSNYDSPSGHNFLVDCLTNLILGCIVYCKNCHVCDKDKGNDDDAEAGKKVVAQELVPAADHRCSKNFVGAAKAMESIGAAKMVQAAWDTGRIWINEIVGDDDSTTRAVLTTNLKSYREDHPDEDRGNYWPFTVNKDGGRDWKRNVGRLHWETLPPQIFWADPTHRMRVIAGHLFKLSYRETETLVTSTDCKRLKKNGGYWQKQFRDKSFQEYKKAFIAVLLHHGNCHDRCGDWCPYARGDKMLEENKKSVRRDTMKFVNIAKVWSTYAADEYLKQTHHPYDSQKVESCHIKVATVAPKSKCFSKTMSLNDRVALVVVVDSVGYDAGISRILCKICGTQAPVIPPVTQTFLANNDRKAKRLAAYNARPDVKKKRAEQNNKKIKKGIEDDRNAKRKGNYYGTGCAIEAPPVPATAAKATVAASAASEKTAGGPKICKWCGLEGHARRSSKKCLQYVAPSKKNTSDEKEKTSDETSDKNSEEPLSMVI